MSDIEDHSDRLFEENHPAEIGSDREKFHYAYDVSIAPSNTPVQSPSKLNVIGTPHISFQTLDSTLFSHINDHFDKSFDSSFKNYSSFSNYTHHSHVMSNIQNQFDSSNFENDILDISFRNNNNNDNNILKDSNKNTFNSIADTLLSFKKDHFDNDNDTISLPFSSSPNHTFNKVLNFKQYEPRPTDDQDIDKFPEFSDLNTDTEYYDEFSDIEEFKSLKVTFRYNNKKLPKNRFSNLNHLNSIITQRQSDIRFKEKSRINYNDDKAFDRELLKRQREQRKLIRDFKRSNENYDGLKSEEIINTIRKSKRTVKPKPDLLPPLISTDIPKKIPSISRSKNGCWTCRIRKKKCSEERPNCNQCINLGLVCDGYSDSKPDFVTNPVLQREKLNKIKEITSRRKRVPVKKNSRK